MNFYPYEPKKDQLNFEQGQDLDLAHKIWHNLLLFYSNFKQHQYTLLKAAFNLRFYIF